MLTSGKFRVRFGDMKQPKDHNGKPITDAQLRMLRRFAEGETIGGMSISGGGEERTWTALRDRGLISYTEGVGTWLTRDGLYVCRDLFPDMQIEDLADPFRGENCGVSDESIDLKVKWHRMERLAIQRGRKSADERRPREQLVKDIVVKRLTGLLDERCVDVTRCVAHDGRCGFSVDVGLEVRAHKYKVPSEDHLRMNRSAFISTRRELDRFCIQLEVGIDALSVLISPPKMEEEG